jgi:eukaryotic-like serine/threonine-protein kinase
METPAEAVEANRIWRFGAAELDERTLELRVRGETVALEPKPMEVLFHLLRHAGEVVTKDELAEACWPRRVLSDSVLTKAVSRLRDVLDDQDQAIIRTVHGYGYRLVAQVSVTAATSLVPAPPKLGLKPGDHPPMRPQWSLVERLGSGRSGEVWLARHDKTREPRVYKFPLDVAALTSLKREITLSRLLGESGSGRMARVLDWNLEQEPYFIESEYASGGNLMQWAERQGGLQRVPSELRVELAAQIAETLAAAHAVGVLHKDLKPANVLVDVTEGAPRIKLSDFGSGGVLDPERLEALGITRLGFTRTLAAGDASRGTPLYLAPEVLGGQPATVQADIYALGVILFQLVVGDFRRPLSPGWEQDIADEMLREDIAEAAAGNRLRRLGDAALLARRLRSLDERRAQRAREREEQSQAEAALRALERMQLRRRWMQATMAALIGGTVVSLALFLDARRARDQAARAAAASEAVAEFLGTDLFANLSHDLFDGGEGGKRPPGEWTVQQLLDAASGQIGKRFSGQPEVAQRIHAALGGAYFSLESYDAARPHYERARELATAQDGPGSVAALRAAEKLLVLDYAGGRLATTLAGYAQALADGEAALGEHHAEVLTMRRHLSWAYQATGDWPQALVLAERSLELLGAQESADPVAVAAAQRNLGNVYKDLGRYAEAEAAFRRALESHSAAPGNDELSRAYIRLGQLQALTGLGRYAEALSEITAIEPVFRRWEPEGASITATLTLPLLRGMALLEQGQAQQAVEILAAVESADPLESDPDSCLYSEQLALAYLRARRPADALAAMQRALRRLESARRLDHPWSLRIRVGMADILRELGRADEAWAVLQAAGPRAAEKLPAAHPILAERKRVEGLLHLAQGRGDEARAALDEARKNLLAIYGAQHWRTHRVDADLARLQPA